MKTKLVLLLLFLSISNESLYSQKYVLYQANWINSSDLNNNSYNRKSTLRFDIDFVQLGLFPSIYIEVKVLYKTTSSSSYTQHSVTQYWINYNPVHVADPKEVIIEGLTHNAYDFKLEIRECTGVPTPPLCLWSDVITSFTCTNNSILCNQKFELSSQDVKIIVISPTSSEHWHISDQQRISWQYSNYLNSAIGISLYKGGVFNCIIGQPTSSTEIGSFDWIVPSNIPYGTDYQVRFNHVACDNIVFSDYFTIFDCSSKPSQPSSIVGNHSVCTGNTYDYSVTNIAGVNYSWSASGGTISGSGSSIRVTWNSPGGQVLSVTPSNNCGEGTNRNTGIAVNSFVTPTINISPYQSAIVCSGESVSFTSSITNGGNSPTYQWYLNGNPVGNSTNYTTPPLSGNSEVYCRLTSNMDCVSPTTVISSITEIYVNPNINPEIDISPKPSVSICDGETVSFTSTVSCTCNPSYQWYLNNIPVGSNSSSYTTPPLRSNSEVYCKFTPVNNCGSQAPVNSIPTSIKVNPVIAPTISISPNSSVTVCSGGNVSFTSTITNGGSSPIYQWYMNGTPVGSNSPNYTTPALSGNASVYCRLTSNASCVTSSTATSGTTTITVNSTVTPSITISPGSTQTICSGQSVQFTATPTNGGNSPVYQWFLNNTTVGTNIPNYTTPALSSSAQVYCRLTSNANCANPTTSPSGTTSITVNTVPPDPIITQNGNILTSNSSIGNQWYNSAGLISGATGQNYSPPPTNDNYYVKVTINGCTSASSNIISFSTGIEINEVYKGISIYPNPAQNSITIENDNFLGPIDFEIINSEGKKVYRSKLYTKNSIDLAQFPSGIYFIKFTEDNSYYLLKFIKE
jgi:hypothetical protein